FFQAEDGIRDFHVTGVQTCALPIFDAVVREDPLLDAVVERGVLAVGDPVERDGDLGEVTAVVPGGGGVPTAVPGVAGAPGEDEAGRGDRDENLRCATHESCQIGRAHV